MQLPQIEVILGCILLMLLGFFIIMRRFRQKDSGLAEAVVVYVDRIPPRDLRHAINILAEEFENRFAAGAMEFSQTERYVLIMTALKDRIDAMEGRISGPENRKAVMKEIARAVLLASQPKKPVPLSLGFLKQATAPPKPEEIEQLQPHFAALAALP